VQNRKSPGFRDTPADFLREGSESERAARELCLLALVRGVEIGDAARSNAGAERLARAVAELPLRYAPFFERLATLWGMSEERVSSELLRARQPRSWALTLVRGLRTFDVDRGGRRDSQRARLLRFAPGAALPEHRHRGRERVLVLEGSYSDSHGTEVCAGEEQLMLPGSVHQLRVSSEGPCIAAVVEQGIDFTGGWLRWASKLLS
jgi:quercetin dioxygenase-like cupin family protein